MMLLNVMWWADVSSTAVRSRPPPPAPKPRKLASAATTGSNSTTTTSVASSSASKPASVSPARFGTSNFCLFLHLYCMESVQTTALTRTLASSTHTHTHNRLTAFDPVPEEILTHSHPSWSSDILYQLPPFTTIHSILSVQFTCVTVLFDNLPPGPLWSSSRSWPSTSYSMHFFTQSSSSFRLLLFSLIQVHQLPSALTCVSMKGSPKKLYTSMKGSPKKLYTSLLRLCQDSIFVRLPGISWRFRHIGRSHMVVSGILLLVRRRGTHCRNVYSTLLTALLLLVVFSKHSSSQSIRGFGDDALCKFLFYITLRYTEQGHADSKPCSKKIPQFFTAGVNRCRLLCIVAIKLY